MRIGLSSRGFSILFSERSDSAFAILLVCPKRALDIFLSLHTLRTLVCEGISDDSMLILTVFYPQVSEDAPVGNMSHGIPCGALSTASMHWPTIDGLYE